MTFVLITIFTLLAVLQGAVFSRRIHKIEKTWDDLVVMVTAILLAVLVAQQFGPLLVSRATGKMLEFRLLVPIFTSLFCGIGYSLMPYTILDSEQRLNYRLLPGLKPELLAAIAFVLTPVGLAVAIFMGG